MPIIRIDYDNEKLDKDEMAVLSKAVRDIVSEVTSIEDVFVYANSSQIKINVAPIEIFIEMSAHKITDLDKLMSDIKVKLSDWKKANNFSYPVNLTVIPMPWKIEIDI